MRAAIIQAVRAFFIGRGYLEIETPNLIPAPAPETHIDAVRAADGFLHPSPELCMKRLLSAGYSAIFQICKCYRGGERGRHHLPEFTLLEWYRAGADYMDIMVECEEMIRSVAADTGRGERIEYMGREIDLKGPWQRMSVNEAFERYSPIPLEDALDADCFDEVMVLHIEPGIDISRPLFLYDYPPSLAALSRIKDSDPPLAERFELYMGGLELANAFSELIDVDEQVKRFEKERERRRRMGKAEYPFPDRFIKELGNMPDSAGIALGIDRLVMLFADTDTIDDVVSFTPEEI
jgi:lysyl-tRNA synthetase class 2